jgi:hypothetical protein
MELQNLASHIRPAADSTMIPQLNGRKLRIVLLCPRGPLYRHREDLWKKTIHTRSTAAPRIASLLSASRA